MPVLSYSYLTMSNSPTQRSAARRGASSLRVGVERGGEPRRRGQLEELRLDIRLRGRIAQRGAISGLDRRALRFPLPHRLDDLMQPCPTLRRDACAALIDLAAATLPAMAGFVAARAP